QRLALLGLLQAQEHLFGLERLGDVVVGACLHGFDGQVVTAVRAHHDHRRVAAFGPQGGEQIHAAHARHANIGDDEVGAEAVDEGHGLLTIFGRLDLVALSTQEGAQDQAQILLVVDDQNALHRGQGTQILSQSKASLTQKLRARAAGDTRPACSLDSTSFRALGRVRCASASPRASSRCSRTQPPSTVVASAVSTCSRSWTSARSWCCRPNTGSMASSRPRSPSASMTAPRAACASSASTARTGRRSSRAWKISLASTCSSSIWSTWAAGTTRTFGLRSWPSALRFAPVCMCSSWIDRTHSAVIRVASKARLKRRPYARSSGSSRCPSATR